MNYAMKDPFDPGVVGVLAPIGVGHDLHNQMCVRLIAPFFDTPEGLSWLANGADRHALAKCWFYGYYLRACEMSLPDVAGESLEGTGSS